MYEPVSWHWHTARTVRHLVDERGVNFALVSMPAAIRAPAESYADAAKLIEGAPKLLKALRLIEQRAQGEGELGELIARTARAAIAEATR